MKGILADINIGKQRKAILAVWVSDTWRELWTGLGLSVVSFPALGLPYNASDALIWRTCQREGPVLITGNRNDDGVDSLEATIRNENKTDSLPVITIADADRVLQDRLYAEIVAEHALDYLMRIDEVRGAGHSKFRDQTKTCHPSLPPREKLPPCRPPNPTRGPSAARLSTTNSPPSHACPTSTSRRANSRVRSKSIFATATPRPSPVSRKTAWCGCWTRTWDCRSTHG